MEYLCEGQSNEHSSSELRVIWTHGYIEGLGTYCKVEKIGVDPMSISPDNA